MIGRKVPGSCVQPARGNVIALLYPKPWCACRGLRGSSMTEGDEVTCEKICGSGCAQTDNPDKEPCLNPKVFRPLNPVIRSKGCQHILLQKQPCARDSLSHASACKNVFTNALPQLQTGSVPLRASRGYSTRVPWTSENGRGVISADATRSTTVSFSAVRLLRAEETVLILSVQPTAPKRRST